MAQTATVTVMPGTEAARLAATGVTLTKPGYTAPHDHDIVYALRGGQVGSCPLGRYRLPEAFRGSTVVAPASGDEDGVAVLPGLARLLDRMAPWLKAHMVPRILTARDSCSLDFGRAQGSYDVGGRLYAGAGGLAMEGCDVVLVQSGSPTAQTSTLCHEVMHRVWPLLSDEATAVLAAAVDGPAWPGRYYADVEERVCRAFQTYAWHRVELEGFDREYEYRDGPLTADFLFRFLFEGHLAALWIGQGIVEVPPTVKAARAIYLPAPPPPPPPSLAWRLGRATLQAAGRAWWAAAALAAPAPARNAAVR